MKQSKRFIAVVLACAVSVSAWIPMAVPASAEDVITVVGLGDDTLVAEEGDTDALTMVAESYNGVAINDAEVGQTSAELVASLESDSAILEDVASADVVVISVGFNDIMNTVFYENTYYDGASDCTTFLELMQASSSSQAFSMIKYVISALPDMTETLIENIDTAVSLVRDANANAEIVVETVQNPMAVDYDVLSEEGLSDNRIIAARELRNYLQPCLQGGVDDEETTYTSSYYGEISVDQSVNAAIREMGVHCADLYMINYGETGEYSMGFYLTNIADLTLTYTAIGQVAMAASILTSSEALLCGDGTVLEAYYAATGEEETVAEDRESLETMIQTAIASEIPVYDTGDLDQDGEITIQDATMTLQDYVLRSSNKETTLNLYQKAAADVDGTEGISITDAAKILAYYVAESSGGTGSWD